MLCKRIERSLRHGFIIINCFVLLLCAGCKKADTSRIKIEPAGTGSDAVMEGCQSEEELICICVPYYEEAAKENKFDDLETVRAIVKQLGEHGFSAVDNQNQVDMASPEQVIRFCSSVEEKRTDSVLVVQITYGGGFVTYELTTENGIVDVCRDIYQFENDKMVLRDSGNYTVENWNYSEDGYLMFSGTWTSEQTYMLMLSETEEHTALRIKSLDETCRELNRKYILPIGYQENNMFLSDWDEDDFLKLNFYDVFDIFYPMVYGQDVPYKADEDITVGAVYQIPEDEFEGVIQRYFNIDSERLKKLTLFQTENCTYEYKPRGFYEWEYPEYPYPEVIDYTENEDGTISLIVNVVFPYEDNSNVYTHEVKVRPLNDGGVQYVSNKVLTPADAYDTTWHIPRLSEEEWELLYAR